MNYLAADIAKKLGVNVKKINCVIFQLRELYAGTKLDKRGIPRFLYSDNTIKKIKKFLKDKIK
jgi:hypothetical protein